MTDDVNLTLQSFMYEASHYQREIYFCKEYRTPELDQVLKKAQERENSAHAIPLVEIAKKLQDGPIDSAQHA